MIYLSSINSFEPQTLLSQRSVSMPWLHYSPAFLSLSLMNNCTYFKIQSQVFFYASLVMSKPEVMAPYKMIPLQYILIGSIIKSIHFYFLCFLIFHKNTEKIISCLSCNLNSLWCIITIQYIFSNKLMF